MDLSGPKVWKARSWNVVLWVWDGPVETLWPSTTHCPSFLVLFFLLFFFQMVDSRPRQPQHHESWGKIHLTPHLGSLKKNKGKPILLILLRRTRHASSPGCRVSHGLFTTSSLPLHSHRSRLDGLTNFLGWGPAHIARMPQMRTRERREERFEAGST